MEKIVYTVLFGDNPNYTLKEPEYINKDWRHICFTDRDIKSKHWEIVKLPKEENPIMESRLVKIMFWEYLPKHNTSMYLDTRFTIKTDLNQYIDDKYDIIVMKHNKRDCLFDELKFLGHSDKSSEYYMYKSLKVPAHAGLYAPGIMIRKNTEYTKRFCFHWFAFFGDSIDQRDIPSFAFAAFCYGEKIKALPFRKTYKEFM